MTRRRINPHVVALLVVPSTLAPTSLSVGTRTMVHATMWLCAQTAISVAMVAVLGLIAARVSGPRTQPYLDQIVSRGLELTAALPMVLAGGVVAVIAHTPIPIAVAVVIGILGGLRCIRIIASTVTQDGSAAGACRHPSLLDREIRQALAVVVASVLEHNVGLEAAIAWLGLFDPGWTGGWGQHLGEAASRGDMAQLSAWTLSTVGATFGLQVMVCRRADPAAEIGARNGSK